MIRGIIIESFAEGEASEPLRDWRTAFAHTLLPELATNPDPEKERAAVAEFADMFAQTLSYGLFSARVVAPGRSFTRENARKLVPRTNPFLRNFFEQITGAALDDEPFAGFVEDIIQTLSHADIDAVLADFGTFPTLCRLVRNRPRTSFTYEDALLLVAPIIRIPHLPNFARAVSPARSHSSAPTPSLRVPETPASRPALQTPSILRAQAARKQENKTSNAEHRTSNYF